MVEKYKYRFTVLITALLLSFFGIGQKSSSKGQFLVKPFERNHFIENKGQFKEYERFEYVKNEDLRFVLDKDFKVFFYSGKVIYTFEDTKYFKKSDPEGKGKPKEERRKSIKEEITIEWVGSNKNVEIITEELTDASYTFSGKNQQGETFFYDCKGFKKIIYKNIYDNINLEYYIHSDGRMKYNFVLFPGAKLEDIKLSYSGTSPVLNNGNLTFQTIKGNVVENAPVSFYQNDSSNYVESRYHLNNNVLSFQLDTYDAAKTIVIDPWIIFPSSPMPTWDNGVDPAGNIYVYSQNCMVEKYSPTGALLWSNVPGINTWYYGDLLVDKVGSYYLSEGFVPEGARTYKFNSNGVLIWQSTYNPSFREHWRLSLNCNTNKVTVAGGGTTNPTLNIAEIDINTGVLINAKTTYAASPSDVSGLVVDDAGKAYLKHSNPNVISFTDVANNPIANVSDGYGYGEIAGGYASPNTNGYNMMTLAAGFLYTSDGKTIHKWNTTTHAVVASVSMPGAARMSSGLIADNCGSLFAGGQFGVYQYNFNLVLINFIPTTTPVYDIAFSATNMDIIACGSNFLTNLPFTRQSCISSNKNLIIDSCQTNLNSVTFALNTGLAPYTYIWSDGNNSATRTNLTPATYTVIIKDASCVTNYLFDTIIIPSDIFSVDFTYNSLCANTSTMFHGISSVNSPTAQWVWDFGNGATNSLQNSSHYFGSGGSYNVKLKVLDSEGCSDSITKVVHTLSPPNANFSNNTVCENGGATSFTNLSTISTGTLTNFSWNFDDVSNNSSTLTNPLHDYANPGNYNVQLIVQGSNQCTDTIIKQVNIHSKPVANFSNTEVCVNAGVTTFVNSSTISSGSILTNEWNFGDVVNNTSSLLHPTHDYNTDGNFNVQLIATSDQNCKDTIVLPIAVHPKPNPNFSVTNECLNANSVFNDLSSINSPGLITNYLWDFGDGLSSPSATPSHIYALDGNYSVKLLVTSEDGCVDSITQNTVIYPLPNADFTILDGCVDSVHFQNSTTISSGTISNLEWNFDDGGSLSYINNPNHLYSNFDQIYHPLLIATSNFGCKDSISKPTVRYAFPQTNFQFTQNCEYDSIVFVNTSNIQPTSFIAHWNWNFGDGSIPVTFEEGSHLFPSSGVYSVDLTAISSNGCSKDTSFTVEVYPKPSANFSSTSVCENFDITAFTNLSSVISGSIQAYQWNFDDNLNSSSLTQNPIFDYPEDGLYQVQLIAETNHNCFDTITLPVVVYPKPLAEFTTSAVCENFGVSAFDNLSSISSGTIIGYDWFFGDVSNNVSTATNPSHDYNGVGPFQVELIATSNFNCKDTATMEITMYPKPVASFSANSVCENFDITSFSNSSSIISGTVTDYIWNFDDGVNNSSTLANPTHDYANDGTYNVQLVANSNFNCKDTLTLPITVYPKPDANFSATSVCENFDITTFSNLSTIVSGSLTNYSWMFDDVVNNSSSLTNPTHDYANDGMYNVQLIANSNFNCKDTVSLPITVYPKPVANFAATSVCENFDVTTFSNSSTIVSGTLASYSWNFADVVNNSSTLTNPIHDYLDDGIYNVQLIANSNFNCKDTISLPITVYPKPNANFSATSVCENFGVTTFSNSSTIVMGMLTNYSWNFDDGVNSSSTLVNPTHDYANDGTYNVQLVANSNFNCKDTLTLPITVYPKPDANFSATSVCENFDITTFSNLSTIVSGSLTNYSWMFDDVVNNSSSLTNPTHDYANDGMYNVQLIANSNFNCKDTAIVSVTVFPKPNPSFSVDETCLNSASLFENSSTIDSPGEIIDYSWNFGDGNFSSAQSPSHLYTSTGVFTIDLILTSNNGCQDTSHLSTEIYPLPSANFEAMDGCVDSISFVNTSSLSTGGFSGWEWNFNDGSENVLITNPYHVYPSVDQYFDVTLIAISNHGCRDTLSKPVIMHAIPNTDFSYATSCAYDAINFTNNTTINQSSSITEWLWSFGDASPISTDESPEHLFSQGGNYSVTLTATSSHGCIEDTSILIEVLPVPLAKFTAENTAGCSPFCTDFINMSTSPNNSVIVNNYWDFGNGAVSSDVAPTTCFENQSPINDVNMTVRLIIENNFGCVDTLIKNNFITSLHNPIANFDFEKAEIDMYDRDLRIENKSIGADYYFWDFGTSNHSYEFEPLTSFEIPGIYEVLLISSTLNNCVDSVMRTINVKIAPSIYVPNAFTPDDSPYNNGFIYKVYGVEMSSINFTVFNRWGEEIYATLDNIPWDGTYNGKMCPEGNYIYRIAYTDLLGESKVLTGSFFLLR